MAVSNEIGIRVSSPYAPLYSFHCLRKIPAIKHREMAPYAFHKLPRSRRSSCKFIAVRTAGAINASPPAILHVARCSRAQI
eukprot:2105561-Pleurochrysis_carterae.AAC.2